MKKNKIVFISILSTLLVLILVFLFLIYKESSRTIERGISEDGDFSVNFIKSSYKNIDKDNFMISPYSVEVALSLLREGSGKDTFKEINSVVPKRNIRDLRVNKKVNIANGVFIKNKYESQVRDEYVKLLKNDYNADVVYDEFKTPDKINEWVNKNTYGMINKVFDEIDESFILGLFNAIALDEEWANPFVCESTHKDTFNKIDGNVVDVSMMYKVFESDVSYYENDKIKSVVIPYKVYDDKGNESEDGEQLEFIGILPNDDIDEFINDFDIDLIKDIDNKGKKANGDYVVRVSLPKFKFDYSFDKFKETLEDMRIRSVFSSDANFDKLFREGKFHVDSAIHKSYVQVDEAGTRAAAVTGFTFKNVSLPNDSADIKFDKPFVFMIKDTKSNEILFFGVVYEPSKYEASKCE